MCVLELQKKRVGVLLLTRLWHSTHRYIRPYEVANKKGVRQNEYRYKVGTTAVTSMSVEVISEVVEPIVAGGAGAAAGAAPMEAE